MKRETENSMHASEALAISGPYHKVSPAARQLQVSDKTLRRWIAERRLTVLRPGGHLVRVPQSEIDRLMLEAVQPALQ